MRGDAEDNASAPATADEFFGGDGDDLFIADEGNDTYRGESGSDTVDFRAAGGRVVVNLLSGSAQGFGETMPSSTSRTPPAATGTTSSPEPTGPTASTGGKEDTIRGGGGADTLLGTPTAYDRTASTACRAAPVTT